MQKKRTKNQLAQLCSQIVFRIFWVWAKKASFAENPVVSAYFEKGKKGHNNVKMVESKIWPGLSQKSVQACYATYLDRYLTQKMVIVCLIFLLLSRQISFSIFEKQNRKT